MIQSEGPATIAAILLETDPGHRGHPGAAARLPRRSAGARRPARHPPHPRRGHVPASVAPVAGSRSTATTSCPTSSPSRRASTPGYVPVGGVIISDAIASDFDERVFPGGLTYSGHPLAMASIVAALDAMESEGIVEHAARDRGGGDRPGPRGARGARIRSSARCAARACSGRSSSSPTARPANP